MKKDFSFKSSSVSVQVRRNTPMDHASSFIFYQIITKVAGNQNRHKSLDEFDFGPDQTTHFDLPLTEYLWG